MCPFGGTAGSNPAPSAKAAAWAAAFPHLRGCCKTLPRPWPVLLRVAQLGLREKQAGPLNRILGMQFHRLKLCRVEIGVKKSDEICGFTLDYRAVQPRSMTWTLPVIAEARSEARKSAYSATSSGAIKRLMAAGANMTFSTTSSSEMPRVRA